MIALQNLHIYLMRDTHAAQHEQFCLWSLKQYLTFILNLSAQPNVLHVHSEKKQHINMTT